MPPESANPLESENSPNGPKFNSQESVGDSGLARGTPAALTPGQKRFAQDTASMQRVALKQMIKVGAAATLAAMLQVADPVVFVNQDDIERFREKNIHNRLMEEAVFENKAECVKALAPYTDLAQGMKAMLIMADGHTYATAAAFWGCLDALRALIEIEPELANKGLEKEYLGGTPLMMAAAHAKVECFEYLLPLSDPKSRAENGATALSLAAMNKEATEIVKTLIPLSDCSVGANGLTPLHEACLAGCVESAWLLLPVSDPKCARQGATPLHFAAKKLGYGAMKLLAPASDLGQKTQEPERAGDTALMCALKAVKADHPQGKSRILWREIEVAMVELVSPESASARSAEGLLPLPLAVEAGSLAVMLALLAAGADPKATNEPDKKTALMAAAATADFFLLNELLPLSDLDAIDQNGATALWHAGHFAGLDTNKWKCFEALARVADPMAGMQGRRGVDLANEYAAKEAWGHAEELWERVDEQTLVKWGEESDRDAAPRIHARAEAIAMRREIEAVAEAARAKAASQSQRPEEKGAPPNDNDGLPPSKNRSPRL